MEVEIIWELTAIRDISTVITYQVLLLARQVEAQRIQTTVWNNLKTNKVFNAIQSERRKDKIISQNIVKQAHANTVDPCTHLDDGQLKKRYVESVARGIIFKQYVEVRQTEQSII